MASTSTMTVAFIGASAGVGLACLKLTLAAGHQCVALCRDPSTLAAIVPPESNTNLRLIKGNAHDIDTVSQLLRKDDQDIVDIIVTTIGNKPSLSNNMAFADPNVCGKGMATLLEALALLRKDGAAGRPYIIACSTIGMSKFRRDVPWPLVPLYSVVLRTPRGDKEVMQTKLIESGHDYTIVQPSLLLNGPSEKPVRVGIEDPTTGPETEAIGYTISREDSGRWVAENLVLARDPRYLNKITQITY